jgi:hypothetical protein
MKPIHVLTVILSLMIAAPLAAGEADVLEVEVINTGSGTYRFSATIRHADTGWDHYANRFEAIAPDGKILGTRTLYHPHVNEQPFTRSQSGVLIPRGVSQVTVRAGDSVHGIGGEQQTVTLP